MMQHVATTKSEVATFATGTQTSSFNDSGANEQFGKLLQEQKTTHPVVVKPESSSHQTSNKKTSQQLETKVKTDVSVQKKSDLSDDRGGSDEAEIATLSHNKTSASNTDNTVLDESPIDKLKVTNTMAELQWVLPANKNDIESDNEPSTFVAEEWVLLIDRLNKLADIPEASTASLTGQESADDLQLPDNVENVENGVVGQIAGNQFADNLRITVDGIRLPSNEDNKIQNNSNAVNNKQTEKTISTIVDKALDEVLITAELQGETEVNVPLEAAKLILEQPEVLEDLIGQLQLANQEHNIDTTEQVPLDSSIDNTSSKDSLDMNQKIEPEQQVDFSLADNKELFKALVTETVVDSGGAKVPVKEVTADVSDVIENKLQTSVPDVEITKLEPVAEQIELIDQELLLTQVVSNNLGKEIKSDKTANNNDIKSLLNLTDSKLGKALENIAQRVFDGKSSEETTSPERLTQPLVITKTAEVISSIESSSKDFVSALKSGLEEFKNQLSQGREPGIDLKALVADALVKTTDTDTVAKKTVSLEQIVSSVSQVVDLAQSMSRTIENRHDQTYSATLRDVAQIQGEQSKQIQLNQFESKFEKAINIAKPEGHQQLAEKVRWMVNTKNLVAEIRLDPAELGSVHVKVAMSGESATVNFVVQSQLARDAVDTATPRLREMLAEKGIELDQSSVRQESDGQQNHSDDLAKQGGQGKGRDEDIEVPEQVLAQQNIVNGALGGIDYFV